MEKKKQMKNRIRTFISALLLGALTLALLLTSVGCKKEEPSDPTPSPSASPTPAATESEFKMPDAPSFDFMGTDLTQYITLGQYKGLTFEIPPMKKVTDQDVLNQINNELISKKYYTKVTDRAVTKNDVVSISYKGLMEGKEFEGGTGKKELFTIYNGGGFIEGFADGIVGMMPGVEKALELTFPETYYDNLAGKPVTFMVTVEHIYQPSTLTDDLAGGFSEGKFTTAEAILADRRTQLEEAVKKAYDEAKVDMVWSKIFSGATEIGLPKDLVKSYYEYDVAYYTLYAKAYGVSYETLLSYAGLTDDALATRAHDNVRTDMIVYSVIKAENFVLDDATYEQMLKDFVQSSGKTEKEILERYEKKELSEMFAYSKIYEQVVSWQTFTEVAESES